MVKNDWPIIDRWWPKRDEWSRLKFGSFLLSLFLLLGALPYGLINRLSAWRGTSTLKVEMALDWELPFVAWMVIPYYSFYLLLSLGMKGGCLIKASTPRFAFLPTSHRRRLDRLCDFSHLPR